MGPFGPYWDDNDWPEFTPMYWMEEFMNRLDDDDDDIRDWMRMQQYSNQFSPGANYPWQPYGDWGVPYTADRFWDAPIYRRYPNYPASRGWRDQVRRDSLYIPYRRADRLPELTPEEYRRLPRQLQRDYERAFIQRYLPEIYLERELRGRRPEPYRRYRPRRR